MPKQFLILNRFDGGINSKDSFRVKITRDNTPERRHEDRGNLPSLALGNVQNPTNTETKKDDFVITKIPDFRTGTENIRDIPDHFLQTANGVMVDSVGKIRSMGKLSPSGIAAEAHTIINGHGIFMFQADHKSGGNTWLGGENSRSRYLAVVDGTSISIYDKDTDSTFRTAVVSYGSTMAKGVFHYIDGALRFADANFGIANIPKWFGYIERTHFFGTTYSDSYAGWYSKDNDLAKPTTGAVSTSYPTAGTGINIAVTENTSKGTFPAETWEVAFSFIYDDNQESLLYIPSTNNTFVTIGDKVIDCVVRATKSFNPRISHCRIYFRKAYSNDSWILLGESSLTSGSRGTLEQQYTSWFFASTTQFFSGFSLRDVPVETYETLNGYKPDIYSLSIGNLGDGYKDSCVGNRRTFVVGPKCTDKNNKQLYMGDVIMYSEQNKFDTFPTHNHIDIGINDGDAFVSCCVYADRLLAFKERTLYVINIASSSDTGWDLESTFHNKGIAQASAKFETSNGVAWVNQHGCFFFDGQQVHDLTINIDDEEWGTDFVSETTQIGYFPKRNQLIVVKSNGTETNSNDIYIYDFRTKSWVIGLGIISDDNTDELTNFCLDWDDNLLVMYDTGVGTIDKWVDTSSNSQPFTIKTKEIDFGNSNIMKKIYKVIISYKLSGGNLTTPITYSLNGEAPTTAMTGDMDGTAFTSKVGVFTFPSETKCKTLILKISSGTESRSLEIQDITIEYRPLYRRVVSGTTGY